MSSAVRSISGASTAGSTTGVDSGSKGAEGAAEGVGTGAEEAGGAEEGTGSEGAEGTGSEGAEGAGSEGAEEGRGPEEDAAGSGLKKSSMSCICWSSQSSSAGVLTFAGSGASSRHRP